MEDRGKYWEKKTKQETEPHIHLTGFLFLYIYTSKSETNIQVEGREGKKYGVKRRGVLVFELMKLD